MRYQAALHFHWDSWAPGALRGTLRLPDILKELFFGRTSRCVWVVEVFWVQSANIAMPGTATRRSWSLIRGSAWPSGL